MLNDEKVHEIFCDALNRPAQSRVAFVGDRCDGQPEIKAAVLKLLESLDDAGAFMDSPTEVDPPAAVASGAESGGPRKGDCIGSYELLELVGEGGFGSVWSASQHEPIDRIVAIKIIKLGMDTKQVIARFEAERQALAMMEHPNIARVFDAGATDIGRPYFVMELIDGEPITTYCTRRDLGLRERLTLFIAVCHAIQHAHQKGVIHRDIKPSNVLVTSQDGVPTVKVIDFGIAKATGAGLTPKTIDTGRHQYVGTPTYMSPEQAGREQDIDTRSDIYALGTLLYELVTDRIPFEGAAGPLALEAFAQLIREVDPPRPSTRLRSKDARRENAPLPRFRAAIRGDVDWIVMKALEKDRARRYQTATDLADDARRYLENEPVSAGPPGIAYKLRKFTQRNKAGVFAAGIVALAVSLGVIGTVGGLARAISEAKRAQRELERASEIKRLVADMVRSVDPQLAKSADSTLMRAILEQAAERLESGAVSDEAVLGELNTLIGGVYVQLELFDSAGDHLDRALEQRVRVFGPESPEAMETTQLLGELHTRRFAWGPGLDHLDRAIEFNLATYGPSAEPTLKAMATRGQSYIKMGRAEEGRAIVLDVLERSESVFGETHQLVLECRLALAEAAQLLGLYDEAESQYQQTLTICRESLGPDHPTTVHTMNMFGIMLGRVGRHTDAEVLHRRALELHLSVFGENADPTAWSTRLTGEALLAQGKSAEGEAMLLTSIERFRPSGASGAAHVAQISARLARLYEGDGRIEVAEFMFRQDAAARPLVWGTLGDETLAASERLIDFLVGRGRLEDAARAHAELVDRVVDGALAESVTADDLDRAARACLYGPTATAGGAAHAIRLATKAVAKAETGEDLADSDDRWRFLVTLARARYAAGDAAGAQRERLRAIELAPESVRGTAAFEALEGQLGAP